MSFPKRKEVKAVLVQQVSKSDFLLIIFTVFAAVFLLVFMNFFVLRGVPSGVMVKYNGEIYAEYSFSELPKEKTLEINTAIGYNIIRIAYNTVEVTEASCSDGICTRGKISRCGEKIVCLPNKIVVEITGEASVDSVSY